MRSAIKEDINRLMVDYQKFHSFYQIENFIVKSSGGNAWMKYKQCLREIKGRYDVVEDRKNEIEKTKLDIEEAQSKKCWSLIPARRALKRKKRDLTLKVLNERLTDLDESLLDTMRELNHFISIAKIIRSQNWGNGALSKETKRSLEAESWREKAKQMLAVDVLAFGQVSKPTIEMIFSMPREERKKLFAFVNPENRKRLIEWAMK